MINFSIILASRERVKLLDQLLESLVKTTNDLTSIEVLVAIDLDDKITLAAVNGLMTKYTFLKFIIFQRQTNFTYYYNTLAAISKGEYIWLLNDDVVFVEKDWDKKALKALTKFKKKFKDGVFAIKTKDNLNAYYACFPALTRKAYEVCGYIVHLENTTNGQDIHFHHQWEATQRLVECPEMKLYHYSPSCGTRDTDEVHDRLVNIAKYNLTEGCWNGEANRLRNLIQNLTT